MCVCDEHDLLLAIGGHDDLFCKKKIMEILKSVTVCVCTVCGYLSGCACLTSE